ncbi:ferredoxin--NADP reductase [Fibrella forsythiae]|uniref:Ferredoxin--NADP reductase n=1 Tax=Fibrella forsythiae TaxID=2817061 RepID=A0ABS3JPY7_9BACT|nr:ferredoxin--NADP reductase [Fibrella forsythiae]MBO0952061.1 ferredoxin--NADP reductase [Fibrella forsythiae]
MTDELIRFRITHVQAETALATSYFLEPAQNQPIIYFAGQFLTILVERHDQIVRRSYSLSSAPGELLRLTIKRVQNGEISRHLLDNLRVGDWLTSLPAAGRFTVDTSQPGDLVLLGAGSGINPLFSILKDVLRHQPARRVTLLYSNTSEADIIFRNELAEWQATYPDRFRLIHLLSHPVDRQACKQGRLNNLLLGTLLPDLIGSSDRSTLQFYICGPADYMRMVQFTLIVNGIPSDLIRKENFVVQSAVVESALNTLPAEAAIDRTVSLQFRGKTLALHVPARKSVLQAALAAGISLPYSCRGGRCSTCMARCTSGQLFMTINDVLTDRDLREGWVLTCTGYPMSDTVKLDI